MTIRLVVIESPYAGDVETNLRYLRACITDCFKRGEVPFASHGLYPGALDDSIPNQRALGIQAGFEIGEALLAAATLAPESFSFVRAFYIDRGWTPGMREGMECSLHFGEQHETRLIPGWTP